MKTNSILYGDGSSVTPTPYDRESDAGSLGSAESRRMFERDQERRKAEAEVRRRVLDAFPDAPSELEVLMVREPWLAEWLTRLAENQSNGGKRP